MKKFFDTNRQKLVETRAKINQLTTQQPVQQIIQPPIQQKIKPIKDQIKIKYEQLEKQFQKQEQQIEQKKLQYQTKKLTDKQKQNYLGRQIQKLKNIKNKQNSVIKNELQKQTQNVQQLILQKIGQDKNKKRQLQSKKQLEAFVKEINEMDSYGSAQIVNLIKTTFDMKSLQSIAFKNVIDRFKNINASKKGNSFKSIFNEEITDDYYCPISYQCFFQCVNRQLQIDEQIFQKLCDQFVMQNKIKYYEMPRCKINKFQQFITKQTEIDFQIRVAVLNKGVYEFDYKKIKDLCINLALHNQHYFLITLSKLTANQTIHLIQQKYQLQSEVEGPNPDIALMKSKMSKLIPPCKPKDSKFHNQLHHAFESVYIYDIESDINYSGQFHKEYALGWVSLQNLKNQKISEQNKIQIFEEMQEEIEINDGINCVEQSLINIIDNEITINACKNTTQINIYLYAHNSQNYDNFLIINNAFKNLKLSKFSKKANSTGFEFTLQYMTKNEDGQVLYVYLHFKDTLKFLQSSLKQLCSDKCFNLPKQFRKIDLEEQHNMKITDFTLSNYKELTHIWKPYLINDVLSLAYIFYEFQKSIFDLTKQYLKQNISTSQIAMNHLKKQYKFQTTVFENPAMNKYVRNFIRAGRVFVGQRKYKIHDQFDVSKPNINKITQLIDQGEGIIPVDYTSLYPSACVQDDIKNPTAKLLMPDLGSVKIIPEKDFPQLIKDLTNLKYHDQQVFLIKCDMYYPKDNKFICNVNKRINEQDDQECVFSTGLHKNQFLTSIQIEDAIKFNNAEIKQIHFAFTFERYHENILGKYMKDLFQKRLQIKEINKIMGDIIKLLMNAIYGKTIQKDQNEKYEVKQMDNEQFKQSLQVDKEITKEIYEICGAYVYKNIKDTDNSNYSVIGCILLSISQRLMNNLIQQIDGFKQSRILYMDTDSMYIQKKYFDLIDKSFIDEQGLLLTAKNDYGENKVIIQSDCLMKKVKRLITFDTKTQKIECKYTFKGLSKTNLTYELYDELMEQGKIEQTVYNKIQKKDNKVFSEDQKFVYQISNKAVLNTSTELFELYHFEQ